MAWRKYPGSLRVWTTRHPLHRHLKRCGFLHVPKFSPVGVMRACEYFHDVKLAHVWREQSCLDEWTDWFIDHSILLDPWIQRLLLPVEWTPAMEEAWIEAVGVVPDSKRFAECWPCPVWTKAPSSAMREWESWSTLMAYILGFPLDLMEQLIPDCDLEEEICEQISWFARYDGVYAWAHRVDVRFLPPGSSSRGVLESATLRALAEEYSTLALDNRTLHSCYAFDRRFIDNYATLDNPQGTTNRMRLRASEEGEARPE